MAIRWALIPLLAFVALATWGLSSPVGASPDEDYHLASIWCGQGFEDGMCEEAASSDERIVPKVLPNAAACYAFHSEVSADCQNEWFVNESPELVSTDRGNFTGDYPPVFYFAMNSLVGDDISQSVVAMRLANAALFVGLVTGLYWLLPRGRRTMLVLGTVVALVPLGIFIIPSINPSGWAVISSAIVFPAMVGFFETTGRRRLALAGVGALGVLIGAGARADAAVYTAIAVVLAALVSASWDRGTWKFLAFPLAISAACAMVYLSSGQNQAASVGLDGTEAAATNLPDQIGYNLLNVPELWAGSFGYWGLGWLDTQLPAVVWVLNLVAFGGVVYLGIRQANLRKTVAVVLALLSAWVLPTVVLVQSAAVVGQEVQPRYLLPLMVLLAQVALYRVEPRRMDLSRSQLMAVAAALTATSAISLHFNIRRYVTGTDVFAFDLDAGHQWWWALPVSPMTMWWLGSVAFGAALFLGALALSSSETAVDTSEDATDVSSSEGPDESPYDTALGRESLEWDITAPIAAPDPVRAGRPVG
jgi:hypothetical protein